MKILNGLVVPADHGFIGGQFLVVPVAAQVLAETFVDPERRRRILTLALPIIAAMTSQALLNVVDTAMVGHLGDAALAAVGLGSFVLFTCQAMILGLSVGVQAIAARRRGEGRLDETAVPLNASLLLILVIGPLLTLVLCGLAPWFFPLLNPDPAVIAGAVPYFQVRMLAGPLMAMNYAFRGYWNGIGQSRLYMTTLLIMHASNVLLNYVLIYGHFGAPALGVVGSGLATALSVFIGTAIYYGFGWRYALEGGFLRRRPQRQDYRSLVRIAVPAGMQHVSQSAGLVALYWIIGRIGTAELAAANVLVNLMTVVILPGMGLAMAAATLAMPAASLAAARWAAQPARAKKIEVGRTRTARESAQPAPARDQAGRSGQVSSQRAVVTISTTEPCCQRSWLAVAHIDEASPKASVAPTATRCATRRRTSR